MNEAERIAGIACGTIVKEVLDSLVEQFRAGVSEMSSDLEGSADLTEEQKRQLNALAAKWRKEDGIAEPADRVADMERTAANGGVAR